MFRLNLFLPLKVPFLNSNIIVINDREKYLAIFTVQAGK